jgi:hypothetical protein
MWDAESRAAGLRIADLVRTDNDRQVLTPENDLLVLVRPDATPAQHPRRPEARLARG